jgi:RNA polymerase sigma-70 factor (ECF subfamily)
MTDRAGSAESPGPDVFAGLHDRDVLHRALATLGPDHRIAVVLRYVDDLSPAEIAARTGDREGTVKSRLHYALRQLRAALDAAERTPEAIR